MSDPQKASTTQLASMLRAGDPGALGALFDAYADRLFGYCWFMLRNADLAQIALRDTLAVAQAHIGCLADFGNFDSWIYSLARAECRRRRPVPPGEADVPPARPSQPDADSRLMAWNAVTSMDAAMEVLELACRHDVDLGLVLGLPGHEARGRLDSARQQLEAALGAEILVSRAGHACPERPEVMRGWTGTVTPELRERVLSHAADCRVCGPSLPRNVSATRVFALLPVPSLPSGARERILAFFADPRMVAYREFAVTRAAEFGPGGFPVGAVGGESAPSRGDQTAAPPEHQDTSASGLDDVTPRAVTLPVDLDRSQQRERAGKSGRAAPPRRQGARESGWVLGLPPRTRVLAVVGVATVVAAVVTGYVLAGQPNRTGNDGHGPTASAGGPIVPRRAGAGVESAVPAGSPTAANRSAPHASPRASELLFAKVTQPLPSITQLDPPVSPPRLPGRLLPQPKPSSSRSRPGERGTLEVSPGTLNLGASSRGVLTITAEGGTETWSASTSSSQVLLGASSGSLEPGQSVTLTVSVERHGGAGGSATVLVDEDSASVRSVQVSWAAGTGAGTGTGSGAHHHRAPKPSSSPTSSPTTSPSPSPSPSPSNSSGSSPPSSPPGSSPDKSPTPAPSAPPTVTASPSPPQHQPSPPPTRRRPGGPGGCCGTTGSGRL